jgi:hypothetical protein
MLRQWILKTFQDLTRDYTDSIIPVKFGITGVDLTNVNDIDLSVKIDHPVRKTIDRSMAQNYSEFRGGGDPLKGLNVAQAMKSVLVGEYYGLIIGIDEYSGEWPPLKNAVNDARGVAELLSSKYTFKYIKTLYNREATRDNILKEFEFLLQKVKENDNVLIYYSGHGEYIQNMNKIYFK